MKLSARGWLGGLLACVAMAATPALGQNEIRIGVLYDLSGPFAAAGSQACQIGALSAIDIVNEKGGVLGKYKIVPVTGDSQSKGDVAINEAERLINSEKVDILLGIYSSAHAVPLATKIDGQNKFMWITTAISSAVFKDKNLKYVFRPTAHSDQFGEVSVDMVAQESKAAYGIEADKLKIAIIYEDGPYGSGVAAGNEATAKKHKMNIVLKEGYAATAPDLSSLVIKLKRARPDVIFHTGYNPDITLFFRQAREQGLKWKALIGHGAGHSQIDKLRETFKTDVDYLFTVDPVGSQLLDPKTLAPGSGELINEMVKRYRAKTGAQDIPPHTSMGFNNTWILLTKLLPIAIEKHGGFGPEALRKAALELDIPEGGTLQGYGVKFNPPGHQMAGQNARSTPVAMQFIGGKPNVVYPKSIRTAAPVMNLPKSNPYAE
jgi:branched-chain amino acid transport system substrate-binding protein